MPINELRTIKKGKGDSSLSGFGVVTLASIFPIIAVLSLAIFVSFQITPDEIIESATLNAKTLNQSSTELTKWEKTPFLEIFAGIQSILPLVIFLMIVLFVILKYLSSPNSLLPGL